VPKIMFLILTLALLGLSACAKDPSEKNDVVQLAKTTAASSNHPSKLNFLIVLADDLGYSDAGFMGGEIDTPNLDKLASDGVTFTKFYAMPTCSPSRAALLSGTDPHVAGLGNMAITLAPNQVGQPGYEGHLNHSVASIASRLKAGGYQTFMTGKWHLGAAPDLTPPKRGFDDSFILTFGGGHFTDMGLIGGPYTKAIYLEDGEQVELPADFYSSRFYVDKMIEYLDNRDSQQPFFAYLAFTAPHWPLQAPAETIKKYHGRYDAGYASLQRERLASLKELNLIGATVEVDDTALEEAWQKLTETEKLRSAKEMEIYAAMIDELDSNLGRMLKYLEDTGASENTVILFMSDNGAEGHNISDFWGDALAAYIDECCDNSFENMGNGNSYLWTGPNWAHASSAPSRLYKGYPTEGGIKVPAFIYNPQAKGQKKTSDQLASIMDIAPTILDMANIPASNNVINGHEVAPITGKSLRPYLESTNNPSQSAEDALGWELFGRRAYRQGDWKLISMYDAEGPKDWELFNLKQDPAEANDLSSENPEKLAEMVSLWEAWGDKNNVIMPDTVLKGL